MKKNSDQEGPNSHSALIFGQKKPWSDNDNSVWLASTIGFTRNIEKFKFPSKLPPDRKKQVISLIDKGIQSVEGLQKPSLIKGEDIGFLEKEFLVEHFLSMQNYNQAQQGEGFVLDENGEFLAAINIDDHVFLQLTDCRGELETAWNRLVKIDTALGKEIAYAFLPKFGFLTADPTRCGTAMTASVFLQLSGLIHTGQIDPVLEKLMDESLTISGIQGSPTEIIGDILVVQNSYTLGVTEENILSNMRNFITKIMLEERSARALFKKEKGADFKDKVSRAYGVLVHSYQIEAVEALNALSLLKLGAESGWITGLDNKIVNELFFNCRRGHLLRYFQDEKIAQEEIPHRRAEYIHKTLKDVKLVI